FIDLSHCNALTPRVSGNFLSFSLQMGFSGKALTNLERFLVCVTPDVPSLTLQGSCSDPNGQWVPPGKDTVEYFNLKDLWDCYYDWSAYGVGTPMMFENGDTMQYHVPYLSAIQIYSSKAVAAASRLGKEDSEGTESDSWSEDSGSDKLSRTLSNNSSKAWDVASLDSNSDQVGSWTAKDNELYLQYNETSPYWQRVPFSEKIAELARSHPALMTLKSADISPTSWMAVAWYPLYSVPCQKSKKDLSSFLTFHTLSSFQDLARTYDEIDTGSTACFSSGWRRIIREKCKKQEGGCISLFPFGLATYKMQKNVWSNTSNKVVSDLYNAADSRLKLLNADHHDFNFFSCQPTCA
ncbi:hypothetical protein V8G54_028816, partial [Vigna mungo]